MCEFLLMLTHTLVNHVVQFGPFLGRSQHHEREWRRHADLEPGLGFLGAIHHCQSEGGCEAGLLIHWIVSTAHWIQQSTPFQMFVTTTRARQHEPPTLERKIVSTERESQYKNIHKWS